MQSDLVITQKTSLLSSLEFSHNRDGYRDRYIAFAQDAVSVSISE